MLTFDNVRFQYAVEDFSIIDHLSFEVQDGEFVSIIGASGCGKSTIFRLVNKLLTPASGVIRVDGESIETKKNYCGYMPQQDLLFPWRTVRMPSRDLRTIRSIFLTLIEQDSGCKPLEYFQQVKYGTAPLPV